MTIPNDEYGPFYETYIKRIPKDLNIIDALTKTFEELKLFLNSLNDEQLTFAYAENKWTIAEVIQHCIDVERLMASRALKVARGESKPIPSFNENDYAAAANVEGRKVIDFIKEWELLRKSNILLFDSFDQASLVKKTLIWKHQTSTRAVAGIIIGHALHHINVLEERYLQ